MSETSAIEWTDATWNPVRGCTKVSAGCKHCYAETFSERFRGVKGHPFEQGFDLRLVPAALAKPLTWKKPRRIFVNSMSDLFHRDVPDEYIAAVFGVMAACPQHTFQVLTKRAERLPRWFRGIADMATQGPRPLCAALASQYVNKGWPLPLPAGVPWPLPNVQMGVSTEDQDTADERIPHLLATPAVVRFVSAEPLLGPIRLDEITLPDDLAAAARLSRAQINALTDRDDEHVYNVHAKLDWVIVGGESGPGARPFDLAWGRGIVEQCRAAGVPVFVKQVGANPIERQPGQAATDPNAFLIQLKSRKGGDMAEWPVDLQVREFPAGYPGS